MIKTNEMPQKGTNKESNVEQIFIEKDKCIDRLFPDLKQQQNNDHQSNFTESLNTNNPTHTQR